MKHINFKYLIFAFLVVVTLSLSIGLSSILNAQPPEMPTPLYMPGERPPGLGDEPIFAPGTPHPTSTANIDEMKLLPKVTPPILPTARVTDLSPELARENKLEFRITKPDGTVRFILIPINANSEEVLPQHLQVGEKSLLIPSLGGRPPLPPMKTTEGE